MVQKKLPLINSAHGSDTRNIINELIKLFNDMGYTYNESLQKAHDILDEAQRESNKILDEAERVNALNENVQQQINTLIAESGTSDAEVLQARIDGDGNEYPVLKERLDESDAQLAQTMLRPEMFGAVGDGITDDSDAIINALASASGNVLKFTQGKTYAYRKKIISDGLKSTTIDFNHATMLDLGELLPQLGGTNGRNPVGIQFSNFDGLTVKGLVHDAVTTEGGRIEHENAHMKNASLEFREGKNLNIETPTFKGTQGAIPQSGYPYHMSLDEALNFGHLKVFNVKNIELSGFILEKGGGAEVIQFGDCTNITVKNSEKLDVATLMSWAKFIRCSFLEFEQDVYSSDKSTSFMDVSGDNITVKNINLDYPNGKLLDVTNEWGEVGGEMGKFIVDNVKGDVSQAIFCSTMAMDFAPEGMEEYKAVAEQVTLKNSTLGYLDGSTSGTLFGRTDRFKNILLENSTINNFFNLTTTRTDNTYVGNYTRKYNNNRFIANGGDSHLITCGVNEFNDCYFNQNWGALTLRDDYAGRVSGAEQSETKIIFDNSTFENMFLRMEANIEYNNCKFINCVFNNWDIQNTIQNFNDCKFEWDQKHFDNTSYANVFRTLTSKEINFKNCDFSGNPKFTTTFFFETTSVTVDQTITTNNCTFNINRAIDATGGTDGSYAIKMERATAEDIKVDINFSNTKFLGKMIAASVRGTVSAHVKLFRLTLENCFSTQTRYSHTVYYQIGSGSDFSKMELILIKNALSNSETVVGFDTTNFAKFVDIDNTGYIN